MKLFNTLSAKKEEFVPLKNGMVGIYVCGPTVYDVGHLGHARSAVAFDVIRRYFKFWKKWEVTFVSNITDVDDKMIKRAAEESITEKQLAAKIIPEYQKDYSALNVLPPDLQPRATEYIPQMVMLIEKLLDKGVAYVTDDGVYFEVNKFKEYGKLSHQKLDELRAGARIAVDEKKKNPEDFAVWKAAKAGEPAWKGPHGIQGRPGWHIECSAMSAEILGEAFDIHGGGIDLQFPHHEDEIAQSKMAYGDNAFARYWLHNGHIQVNKEKMSKSLGNFFTIKDILAKYNPLVVRYFLLSTHYRMPIEFAPELLEQARNSLSRLRDCYAAVARIASLKDDIARTFDSGSFIKHAQRDFEAAMDEDFEISRALAAVFDFVAEMNRRIQTGDLGSAEASVSKVFFDSIDAVLAIFKGQESQSITSEIEELIAQRNEARAKKDFKRSDEIRAELSARGIELDDTKNGTVWKKIL